jgi:hypothetical protein
MRRYIASQRNVNTMIANFNVGPLDFSHLIAPQGMSSIVSPSSASASIFGIDSFMGVNSSNTMTLTPNATTVATGQTVEVVVELDIPGEVLFGIEFSLSYNESALSLTSPPAATNFNTIMQGLRVDNYFMFDELPAGGHNGVGTLVTLVFDVLDDTIPSDIAINIEVTGDEWGLPVTIPNPTPITINPSAPTAATISNVALTGAEPSGTTITGSDNAYTVTLPAGSNLAAFTNAMLDITRSPAAATPQIAGEGTATRTITIEAGGTAPTNWLAMVTPVVVTVQIATPGLFKPVQTVH